MNNLSILELVCYIVFLIGGFFLGQFLVIYFSKK